MSHPILPLPLVHALVGPKIDSMPLMLILFPLSFVTITAAPSLYPKALLLIVDILTGITGPTDPREHALAIFHPVAPVAVVLITA